MTVSSLEWEIKKLSEIADVIDSLHKTPPYSETGYPMVRVTDVKGGFLDLSDCSRVTESVFIEFTKKYLPQKGDIVFSRVGTYGLSSYVSTDEQFCLGQNTAIIKAKVNSRFLYYSLLSPYIKEQIERSVVGSTQKTISLKSIRDLSFAIPPLPIQQRIAEILGRLDDKIEVNRRINRTLEAMAQTLYQHWFVDFGPFQTGEFVESELGPIPVGWEVKRLDQVAKINPDTIRKGEEPNEIVYVDIASVSPGRIDEYTPMLFADAPSRARRLVAHGDTIWSGVRPGRRSFSLIQHPVDNLVVSTGFIVNRPKSVPYTYLYAVLSTQEFTDYLERRATGAAYPAVRSSDFDEALIVIPPKSVLDQFHTLTDSWFEQRYFLHREEQQLAAIRDYLLPKLLSGEVPVLVGDSE